MNKLKGAKAKGTYDADMKKIEKSALLVLDDLFILGLDSKERAMLAISCRGVLSSYGTISSS